MACEKLSQLLGKQKGEEGNGEASSWYHWAATQDNVALIAVLEALDPQLPDAPPAGASPRKQLICIANTHIHANPELNDVKLWQVTVHSWGRLVGTAGARV